MTSSNARARRGRPPSHVASSLARFPNDTAMCRALWLPTADRGFVPQGLTLDGDTAWVSGYRWNRRFGDRPCRLVHVSLRTGRLLATTHRLSAAVYGPRPTFCRHGGAIVKNRYGLWVAEKERLWLVDPERVGHSDQVRRVWRIEAPVQGSVLLGGARSALARGSAGRGVWSTSSVSSCGMLVSPTGVRRAFLPGAEGIEFDGRGGVWVVSETAARTYQSTGRPLVPMLARFDVRQLERGVPEECSW